MQKKIIALAIAAAFAAPAVALADVTVYGTLDGGLRSATAAGVTSITMGSGTYNSNRFGIKGSDDLGDGMKAIVNLEGGIDTGTGGNGNTKTATTNTDVINTTSLFDRASTVGLEGGFGKVEMGRQYSVPFKVVGTYDPFGFKFINIAGGASAATVARYNNDVAYTGKFGDVTVMAEHNVPSTGDDSTSSTSGGVTYASGDVNVGGAYSKTKVNGTLADTAYYTVGAGYKFGDAKVSVGYAKNDVANATVNALTTHTFLGGSYNVSSKIGATLAYYKKVSNTAGSAVETTLTNIVGAVTYAMSKKTSMYVEADKQSSDTSGTTTDTSGWSMGLATAF